MPSLKESFQELRQRLKQGYEIRNTGDDPVTYLIFDPKDMLEVKRQFKVWSAKLEKDGWIVHGFSMAEAVKDICWGYSLRDVWLEAEAENPFDFDAINETIKDTLLTGENLSARLQEKLDELTGKKDVVLFVTDIEALAPYLRVGALEQKLHGKFTVPTIILYPGSREGWTLSFLKIYPADGNYRANFIGG
jgi:hypothetical protein